MTAPSRRRFVRLEDPPCLPQEGAVWRPIRRMLGLTGIGANAYTGVEVGDEVIESHDELGPNAGGHEELYVVLTGRARFEVGGEEIDAPPGTMVRADVDEHRHAHAVEPQTTVLVLGGRPGAALPPSAFEYWYAAEPAYLAGEYERGIEILSEGLADHPESPGLNYQLACHNALAGHGDEAVARLRIAVGGDERVAGWAAEDKDLDTIRDRPDYPLSP